MLVYEGFDPSEEGLREALTSMGNGYFCIRGAPEWEESGDVHYHGTYAHGVYNRQPAPTSSSPALTRSTAISSMGAWSALIAPGSHPLRRIEPLTRPPSQLLSRLRSHFLPAEELTLDSASLDLLVIGSRSYGPIGRLVHGNTAQQLARTARCPLLVPTRAARNASLGLAGDETVLKRVAH